MHKSSDDGPNFGALVPGWNAPPVPTPQTALIGAHVELVSLLPAEHAADLFACYAGHNEVWDYLPYGPFQNEKQMQAWMTETVSKPGHQFFAIRPKDAPGPQGVASFLRITPESGSIEVGHINLSPVLQRSVAATEAMYLMMKWAFDAGYRRYEWKCDALNLPSRRAAQRLGFSYEGVFRQATIVKGRNRDTAWFAVIDNEWPDLQRAFDQWLSPQNFKAGVQRESLSALTAPVRVASDPVLSG